MKRRYLIEATVKTIVECEADQLAEHIESFQDLSVGAALSDGNEIRTIKLGLINECQKKL